MTGGGAVATTTISGPVDLGTAAAYGVIAGSNITNTGPTQVGVGTSTGDVGVYPGSSITGFSIGNGTVTPPGVLHTTPDGQTQTAQADLTTAYNVATGLTPTGLGLGDLTGQTLVPGVYAGNLSLTGPLTLAGSASSVWVFQASSTLLVGSSASIVFSGGAGPCNVFWTVPTSATIGSGAAFAGNVMAYTSITADTGASIVGRLLAQNGAVTLDDNVITVPATCGAGTVTTSPTITSGAPTQAHRGSLYSFAVTASGSPGISYSVTGGSLAPGLSLNSTTGTITGTPTTAGTFPVTISANNGISPPSTASYSFAVLATLALTGVDVHPALEISSILVVIGIALLVMSRRRRVTHRM